MRFRSTSRIRSSLDFQHCQKKGKRHSSPHMVLVHLPKPEKTLRLGIIVSKKIGNAVIRNRWKRVIRDTFRNYSNQLNENADHIVIVRNTVRGKPSNTVKTELISLFSKVQKS